MKAIRNWGIYPFCAIALGLQVFVVCYMAFNSLGIAVIPYFIMSYPALVIIHFAIVGLYVFYHLVILKKKHRGMWVLSASLGISALLCASVLTFPPAYRNHVRREWKERALVDIRAHVNDPQWIKDEVTDVESTGWWQSDSLLLMKSGEWLIYEHKDNKQDWRIEDIMIAKASNGKWYYSTFHFCIGLTALNMCQDVQPENLEYFLTEYRFEEFDGVSDECLKKTASLPKSWDARDSQ